MSADGPRRSPRLPSPRRVGPLDGQPEVFAADEQSAVAVDLARLAALADAVLVDEGVRGRCELTLLLVDEGAIAELNEQYLDGDGPTDVLAFPIDDEPPAVGRSPDAGGAGPDRDGSEASSVPLLLGDVVICPSVAARNAIEHGVAVDDELALLVTHGILHVLGMDHAEPEEAEQMQARERELLGRHWARPS